MSLLIQVVAIFHRQGAYVAKSFSGGTSSHPGPTDASASENPGMEAAASDQSGCEGSSATGERLVEATPSFALNSPETCSLWVRVSQQGGCHFES